MKIDRLISIIMVLLERKKISATKLAAMFEVTPRTIYRDIDTINQAGIPIVTYPGVNGGIGILEEFKIDKKLFTTSDITTLLIGLGSISSTLFDDKIVNTLAKVKGLIPDGQKQKIELKSNQISIDLTSWSGNKNLPPILEEIKHALDHNQLISFQYYDRDGNKTNRKIEPYRLILKEANWYLSGYCTYRENFRIFKLSRITGFKILEDTFVPREYNPQISGPSEESGKRIVTIKLLIDESIRDRVVEYCGDENIETYKDNKLVVHFPFMEDDYGYNLLLSFGDKCECLEPENIREEIIRRINKLSLIYQQ
ncbi:putative DNA-binding transcriptional regulator YafY [Mobilisporobacter senegalensis]|uniref:Putative DNA-binding transcriptional regulator YafY n=1 Tax=Mobilisporobacter senegalensis TaxID=1329262 RepID=A0A3N1XR16_9FIRM|nr:YafY family protein [Mobilisporobacter senegalensis]ROR28591.1 putative DNA-binding transcriptional regulator YafY [Mobilisporobacter senegalensis]